MARGDVFVWRIAKHTPEYAADDLGGGGAKRVGGRWNRKGTAVIYTSQSIALATLESLAHEPAALSLRNAFLVRLRVPASVWRRREEICVKTLPISWCAEPAGSTTLDLGEAWLASVRSALLAVPSVIVPEESNILINPLHPDARRIRADIMRQYIYDPRL